MTILKYSYQVPGEIITIEVFTQATCAQLYATIFQNISAHYHQQYSKLP
jgi:hypothetical protein